MTTKCVRLCLNDIFKNTKQPLAVRLESVCMSREKWDYLFPSRLQNDSESLSSVQIGIISGGWRKQRRVGDSLVMMIALHKLLFSFAATLCRLLETVHCLFCGPLSNGTVGCPRQTFSSHVRQWFDHRSYTSRNVCCSPRYAVADCKGRLFFSFHTKMAYTHHAGLFFVTACESFEAIVLRWFGVWPSQYGSAERMMVRVQAHSRQESALNFSFFMSCIREWQKYVHRCFLKCLLPRKGKTKQSVFCFVQTHDTKKSLMIFILVWFWNKRADNLSHRRLHIMDFPATERPEWEWSLPEAPGNFTTSCPFPPKGVKFEHKDKDWLKRKFYPNLPISAQRTFWSFDDITCEENVCVFLFALNFTSSKMCLESARLCVFRLECSLFSKIVFQITELKAFVAIVLIEGRWNQCYNGTIFTRKFLAFSVECVACN